MFEQAVPKFEVAIEDECPSCGHQGLVIGTSLFEEVYQCKNCELCFLKKSVRPNSANDNNWYEELRDCPQSWIDTYVNDMKEAYSRQIAVLEKFTKGKSILDVGCGIGVFLSIAKNKNWDVFGVDESEHAAYFAEKNFNIKYSSSLNDFPENTFDVIRISHVLEHVPEPREFLTQLYRILKPTGILVIIVPNCEPLCAMLVNRLRRIWSDKPKLTMAVFPDMHVLGFSPKSLLRLVSFTGWESRDIFTVSMGNKTYYPMLFDGLLTIKKISDISPKSFFRYYLPLIIDNLGNKIQRGQWIVGYFHKQEL